MRFQLPIFISILLGGTAAGFAADYRVTAAAVDSLGQPESFVTWRVFALPDTVRPVAGAVTGEEGLIDGSLKAAGDYRLEAVGMSSKPLTRAFTLTANAPVADLGKLVLEPSATQLNEITVTAMRPLVSREIDRIGYDVKSDIDAPTSNLSDILRKVPMVSVEADGTIKVNGSSDFRIYKNGRPNNSFTKNAKDIFKAIPASSIKKIEVITDPGAREDAEGVGAILNIVTDSEVSLKGVMGTVSLGINTQNAIPDPNLYLSTQIDKVTMSLHGGYFNNNKRQTEYETELDGTYQSSGNHLSSHSKSKGKSNGGYGGLEASWEPDTMNLVTVSADFFRYGGNTEDNTSTSLSDRVGQQVYSYDSYSWYPNHSYLDLSGAVNYQRSTRRKGETITASYQISTTNQKQEQATVYSNMVNAPFAYTGINSNFDLNFTEHTAQIDWSRPYGEIHKLDIGGKYIFRDNHSKNYRDYVGQNKTFDDFVHQTSIGALYADYRVTITNGLSARAGLRYEFSHLSAKFKTGDGRHFGSDLHDFAPNASVNWNINDANSLKLSYNRRISRPGISYLDPTVSVTPLTTSSGNPNLHSAANNELRLNYSLFKPKFNMDLTVIGTLSNDRIDQVKTVENDHTYYTYDNINHFRRLSFNGYVQWSPFEKTSITMNLSTGYSSFYYPTVGKRDGRWYCNPYLYIRQSLPWKLSINGWLGWWSGSMESLYSYSSNDASNISYGLNLTRSFLKEDRLTVRINAFCPFGPKTFTFRTYSVNSDYLGVSTGKNKHRINAGLSLSYRFGTLNAQVKRTAASIENDDLSGRKR